MVTPEVGPATFLVGAERSGTTLLRLMLDGHPEIAFLYEFEFAIDMVSDDGRWPDLDAYHEFLRMYRWGKSPPRIDRTLDYPSLVRSFLQHKRITDGKPRVGATVHTHFDRLLHIWPDARFIHLLRDGRDVARSCVAMGWAGNAWTAGERWITAEKLWRRCVELIPESRRIDVRYEDLVSQPVVELTRICSLIGVSYHPSMLSYPERSTYKYPTPELAYQWRRKLDPRELRLLEARMGDLLTARGYELSGLPPYHPGALGRAALRAHDRVMIARARARKLGRRLWLESLVSNRIGTKSWRDSVRVRTNAVMKAQLE